MKLARLVLAFVLAVSAFAADINGKWKSVMEFNGQSFEIMYEFKADGGALTGTVTGPNGSYSITNGKLQGDDFSFAIATDQFQVNYKGKVAEDHLNITVRFGDNDLETTAKRP